MGPVSSPDGAALAGGGPSSWLVAAGSGAATGGSARLAGSASAVGGGSARWAGSAGAVGGGSVAGGVAIAAGGGGSLVGGDAAAGWRDRDRLAGRRRWPLRRVWRRPGLRGARGARPWTAPWRAAASARLGRRALGAPRATGRGRRAGRGSLTLLLAIGKVPAQVAPGRAGQTQMGVPLPVRQAGIRRHGPGRADPGRRQDVRLGHRRSRPGASRGRPVGRPGTGPSS